MHAGSTRGLGLRADSSMRLCHWRGNPVNFCSFSSKPVCTRCSKLDGAEISTRFFFFPNMVSPGRERGHLRVSGDTLQDPCLFAPIPGVPSWSQSQASKNRTLLLPGLCSLPLPRAPQGHNSRDAHKAPVWWVSAPPKGVWEAQGNSEGPYPYPVLLA